MDGSSGLGLVAGTVGTEAHPYCQRVGDGGDRCVETTIIALGIIVVVGASGAHAAGIHPSVRQVAVGSGENDRPRPQSDAF